MSVRLVVKIDEEKCDGCGDCVPACAEGAIQIIDGKAKLVGDILCDGMGACLGDCPLGAITMEERDAVDYDEAEVQKHLAKLGKPGVAAPLPMADATPPQSGCPGSAMRQLGGAPPAPRAITPSGGQPVMPSQLNHWPVQLMLVPPGAPFLQDADLLICADCVPFTVPDFHFRYLTGRAVLIGCPKLDDLPHYMEKLKEIFKVANPRSITALKMEVPCCHGIAQATVQARNESAPMVPIEVHTIGIQGGIEVQVPPRAS